MKLRSSVTLIAHAAPSEPVFRQVLEDFFGGRHDEAPTNAHFRLHRHLPRSIEDRGKLEVCVLRDS